MVYTFYLMIFHIIGTIPFAEKMFVPTWEFKQNRADTYDPVKPKDLREWIALESSNVNLQNAQLKRSVKSGLNPSNYSGTDPRMQVPETEAAVIQPIL